MDQESASYVPQANSGLVLDFINKVLLGQPYPVIYLLPVAAFVQHS
jgi:hypothetical protein